MSESEDDYMKESDDERETKKPRMLSNKISSVNINKNDFKNKIPSKSIPVSRKYFYQISLNNPSLFFKFINAIASAVTELKIHGDVLP